MNNQGSFNVDDYLAIAFWILLVFGYLLVLQIGSCNANKGEFILGGDAQARQLVANQLDTYLRSPVEMEGVRLQMNELIGLASDNRYRPMLEEATAEFLEPTYHKCAELSVDGETIMESKIAGDRIKQETETFTGSIRQTVSLSVNTAFFSGNAGMCR